MLTLLLESNNRFFVTGVPSERIDMCLKWAAIYTHLVACDLAQESDSTYVGLAKGQFGSTRIGSQLVASLLYGLQDASNEPACLDKGVSFLH